jgi:hypothetical protein
VWDGFLRQISHPYSAKLPHTVPMPWPSPDIAPLDFFLWGYVKSNVFRTPINGLDDLKTRIRNAISAIPADMLRRTWQELSYHLVVLRPTKEAHIKSTDVRKQLPELHYDRPQTACGELNLFARHNFSNPRRDFMDTLCTIFASIYTVTQIYRVS